MESISIETPTILGDAEPTDAVISEVRKGLISKWKSLAPWLFYDMLDLHCLRKSIRCRNTMSRGSSEKSCTLGLVATIDATLPLVTALAHGAGS